MGKAEPCNVFLKEKDTVYYFLKFIQNKDGSIECAFPYLTESDKRISQKVVLEPNEGMPQMNPRVIHIEPRKDSGENNTYITYHTTGQVNYHNMSFSPMYMEPLYNVERVNPFFIMSFCMMDKFTMVDEKTEIKGVILDITEQCKRRKNVIVSIAPCSEQPYENKQSSISFAYGDMFRIILEFLDDEYSFGFSKIYEVEDCVKIQPNTGLFEKTIDSKNQAFIKYQQKLYQTNEAIILPPNGEGILQVIFTVEMRRKPWIKICFSNKDYEARLVEKNEATVKFKVFDRKKNRFIKRAEEIRIVEMIMDAEIYEDELTVPNGYL